MSTITITRKHPRLGERKVDVELCGEEQLSTVKVFRFVEASRLGDPGEQTYPILCEHCGQERGRVRIHAI
jgi:hypothetical protein